MYSDSPGSQELRPMPVLLGSCCGIVRTTSKRARGHVFELTVQHKPGAGRTRRCCFYNVGECIESELCEGLEVSGRSIAQQGRASSNVLWVSFNLIYNTEGLTHVPYL